MKNLLSRWILYPGRQQSENKRKQKDRQILGPCQRTKKTVKCDSDTSCSWCTWNSSQRLGKIDWRKRKLEEESRPSRPQQC